MRRYFSFRGQDTRKQFWLINAAILGIAVVFGLAFGTYNALVYEDVPGVFGLVLQIGLFVLVSLAGGWVGLAAVVRRLRDAAFSPWLAAGPIIINITGVVFLLATGDPTLGALFQVGGLLFNMVLLVICGFFPSRTRDDGLAVAQAA